MLYEIWSDGRRPFDEVLTAKLVRKGIVTDTLKLKPPPGKIFLFFRWFFGRFV